MLGYGYPSKTSRATSETAAAVTVALAVASRGSHLQPAPALERRACPRAGRCLPSRGGRCPHRMPAGSRRRAPQTSTCRFRGSRRTGCARARARCPSSCAGASRGASATRSTGVRTPCSDGEAGCTSDTLAGIRRRTDPRAGPWHRDKRVASCGAGDCIVPCARIGRTIPTRPAQGLTRSRACVENKPDRAGQGGQSGWLADQG